MEQNINKKIWNIKICLNIKQFHENDKTFLKEEEWDKMTWRPELASERVKLLGDLCCDSSAKFWKEYIKKNKKRTWNNYSKIKKIDKYVQIHNNYKKGDV